MQNNRQNDLRIEYSRLQNQRHNIQKSNTNGRPQSTNSQNRIYPNTVNPIVRQISPPQRGQNINRRPQSIRIQSLTPRRDTTQFNRQNINFKPSGKSNRSFNQINFRNIKKKRRHSKLRDFFFGLAIGLVVFGTAAFFVCRAIIEIFL